MKQTGYHGGAFEGNDCKKLLKNVGKLEELGPNYCDGFIAAFKVFDTVVAACYGHDISLDFEE